MVRLASREGPVVAALRRVMSGDHGHDYRCGAGRDDREESGSRLSNIHIYCAGSGSTLVTRVRKRAGK